MDIVVTEAPADEAVIVALTGQLDVDTCGQLRAALDGICGRLANRLVVDLSGLDFCDSIGLSTLVLTEGSCAAEGGWLRIAAPSMFLTRVLEVTGLLGRLQAYDSVSAALAGDPDALISR
jgi:anti-sigma B factor antagonist